MSEHVAILGGGGHGKVVLETARAAGHRVVGVLDANADRLGDELLGAAILGKDDRFDLARSHGATHYLVGVGHLGDATVRRRLADAADAAGLLPATAVHPTAHVAPSATLAPGTVVLPEAIIHTHAVVAEHVIVNTAAIVDHDVDLEPHVHVAIGATLAGGVRVEAGALIGASATVLQNLVIGEAAVVAAAALVTRDVPAGVMVRGIPAR